MAVNSGDFTLSAVVNTTFDEAVALQQARDLAKKLQVELNKNLNLTPKIDGRVLTNFNQQLDATARRVTQLNANFSKLTASIEDAGAAGEGLGTTLVSAFIKASASKDAYIANLKVLQSGLAATESAGAAVGRSLTGAFNAATTAVNTVGQGIKNVAQSSATAIGSAVGSAVGTATGSTVGTAAGTTAATAAVEVKPAVIPLSFLPPVSALELDLTALEASALKHPVEIPARFLPPIAVLQAELDSLKAPIINIPGPGGGAGAGVFSPADTAATASFNTVLKETQASLLATTSAVDLAAAAVAIYDKALLGAEAASNLVITAETDFRAEVLRSAGAFASAQKGLEGLGTTGESAFKKLTPNILATNVPLKDMLKTLEDVTAKSKTLAAVPVAQTRTILPGATSPGIGAASAGDFNASNLEQLANGSLKASAAVRTLGKNFLDAEAAFRTEATTGGALFNFAQNALNSFDRVGASIKNLGKDFLAAENAFRTEATTGGALFNFSQTALGSFEKIGAGVKNLPSVVTGAFKNIPETASTAFNKVVQLSASGVLGVENAFSKIPGAVSKAGRDITTGFTSTFRAAQAETNAASASLDKFITKVALGSAVVVGFSLKLFESFQQAQGTVRAVFGDASNQVDDFISHLNNSAGLTKTAALKISAGLGEALTGAGFSQATAAKLVQNILPRASDIAAAFGQPVADVAQTLQLALEGNIRGLKALGIEISVVDENNKALALGFDGTFAKLNDAQKATVIYSLILDKTDNIQGAAARSAGNLRGTLSTLKGDVSDLGTTIGGDLAPPAAVLLGIFDKLLTGLQGGGGVSLVFRKVAEAAGLVAIGFAAITKLNLIPFFTGLVEKLALLPEAFLAADTAVEGFGAAVGLAADAALGPFGIAIGLVTAALLIFNNHATTTQDRIKGIQDAAGKAGPTLKAAFSGIDLTAVNANLDALKQKAVDAANAAQRAAHPDISTTQGRFEGQNQQQAVHDAIVAQNNLKDTVDARAKVEKTLRDLVDAGGPIEARAAAALITSTDARSAANKAIDDEIQKQKDLAATRAKDQQLLAAEATGTTDATQKASDYLDKLLNVKSAQDALNDSINAVTKAQQAYNNAIAIHNAELAQKKIDLTNTLTDALAAQKESVDTLNEANAALAKAQQGPTPLEQAQALDTLTAAQNDVTQALIDQKKAHDALNAADVTSINLSGLSLDQIRIKLAQERSNLAAQQGANNEADKKAQLALDAAKSDENVLKTQNAVKQAQLDILTLQKKGTDEDDKVVAAKKQVESATLAVHKANEAVTKDQDALNKLTQTDLSFTQQLASLNDSIDAAKKSQAKSEDALAKARADAVNNQTTINNLKLSELGTTNQIIANIKSIGGLNLQAAKAQFNNEILPFLLSQAIAKNGPNAGQALSTFQTPQNIQDLAEVVAKQIIDDPSSDVHAILARILRGIGLTIPGFAKGGVIEGMPGAMGVLARLGEFGKREAVLPLSNNARMQELLRDNRVLNPVLNALPRIDLSQAVTPISPLSRIDRQSHTASSGNSQQQAQLAEQKRKKEQAELAAAIASETVKAMVAAGIGMEGNTINMQVEQAPNVALTERAMRKAVERALEQRNR